MQLHTLTIAIKAYKNLFMNYLILPKHNFICISLVIMSVSIVIRLHAG